MVSYSGCSCARAMNFSFLKLILFLKLFRSRKSFQLLPNAWLSRVILKPKVTSWSTWLLLFLLVFVLPRWIFVWFVRFADLGIHSNIADCVIFTSDLKNWRWRLGLRDFSTSRRPWRDLEFQGHTEESRKWQLLEWIPWSKIITKQQIIAIGHI